MAAAGNGHVDVVARLIEVGANVNFQNRDGITALMRAAENDHLNVAELLIARGADVNLLDSWGIIIINEIVNMI